jgi:MFS family permease
MMFYGVVSAFRDPMIAALLSERTKKEDQGGIMGINQAYIALGQILGPLTAGLVSIYSVRAVFLLAAGYLFFAAVACRWLFLKKHHKLDL